MYSVAERKLLHFMSPHDAGISPITHPSRGSSYLSVALQQDYDNILEMMTKEIFKS